MNRVETLSLKIIRYFKRYYLIYLGVFLCNFCAFTFYNVLSDNHERNLLYDVLIPLFFIFSFGFPVIFGIVFCVKSFTAKGRKEALSNIIHSYLAIILIFAATYFQCSVLGDLTDAANKRELYALQRNRKEHIDKNITFMRVNDTRAFKGIKPRLWSGIDYPALSLLLNYNGTYNPDLHTTFTRNGYEDLSIEQIERITNNINDSTTNVIEYIDENEKEVYGNCLYYSVICIATVGFGDISPNLWYTKFFTAVEILGGMTIFIFAIGFLFTRWSNTIK
jgi:hypothetical protein